MRRFLSAIISLGLILAGGNAEAQFPSPTFQNSTILGNQTVGGQSALTTVTASGSAQFQGGGSLLGTFSGPTVLTTLRPVMQNATSGTLPTPLAPGDTLWVTDCLNSTQTIGFGTGCLYTANDNLTWVPLPNPSNLTVTVGGQGIFLGGATANQGNGPKIQLSTGTTTTGHCVQFDTNGNTVDAGSACNAGGGGGGSGVVSSGTTNQLGFYSSSGTTISGLSTANNAVLVTNGTGVPSESTTLPTGLTLPSELVTTGLTLFGTSTSAVQGGGVKIQLSTGTATSGHCVQFDAAGNTVDAGGACTTGGGGGTVSAGTTNQLPFYTGTGTTLGPLTIVNSAVLVTSAGGVPSEATTLPSGLTIPSSLVTTGLTLFGTATSSVQGGGTKVQLSTGSFTSGHCVQFDAAGNTVDAGGACTTGGGGGTISAGTVNEIPFYTGSGTTVGPLVAVNNAVLVTNGSGVPSESTTLPGLLTIPSASMTTALTLFGTATSAVQGNGTKVQLSTGTTTSGHCVQYDSSGNVIDSGSGCGAGGGVTAGTTNQIGFYSSSGSVLSGFGTVNNAVVVTSGAGVPSESTTLPTTLTIPTATLSNPVITGTGTYIALTGTGLLTTAASTTTSAGLSILPGTAPTSPANGNVWETTAGVFARVNGATLGPLIAQSSLSGTAPIIDTAGAFSCPTCALTTNGGMLTAVAPMAISAGGAISLGTLIGTAAFVADSTTTVHADTYPLPMELWPWQTGTITSVTYHTGGTSTPAFGIALQINGVNVTPCNGITVNSTTDATTNCTSTNTITVGQKPTLVVSGIVGSPFSSVVQVNYTHSNP